jgi:hypothetical protein
MTLRDPDRGSALPAALLVVAVAAVAAASLATLARTEVLLARNRVSAVRALSAADGCVANVVSALPIGWGFDALLLGADGAGGTADDGVTSAPSGCTAVFRPAPDPAHALLNVEATAGEGRRALDAVVGRAAEPAVPALLWLSDAATLGDVTGSLTLSGADPVRPGAPRAPIAAPGDPALLDTWLAAHTGGVVIQAPASAPFHAPAPPLAELARRARAAGALPGGTLVPAGTPPLALTLIPGDLAIDSAASGRGLLLVDGLLDIAGTFEFSGVVVASAGIRVASGARLDVAGAIWLGNGATLTVEGDAHVAADGAALDAADGLLRLPRRAVVSGMRDAS